MDESKNSQIIKGCGIGLFVVFLEALFIYFAEGHVWKKSLVQSVPIGAGVAIYVSFYRENRWAWLMLIAGILAMLIRIVLGYLLGL